MKSKVMKWVIRILSLGIFGFLLSQGKMNLWLVIFAVSVVLALLAGRIYCGYLCPMNTVMNLSESIAKKLGWKQRESPKFLQSEKLPWVFLALSLVVMIAAKRILQKNIPVLLIWLVLSFLITLAFKPEFFHVFLCPFSALQRLTGKYALYSENVSEKDCISCGKCVKVCPALAVSMEKKQAAIIDSKYCLQCKRCREVCPTEAIAYRKN